MASAVDGERRGRMLLRRKRRRVKNQSDSETRRPKYEDVRVPLGAP